MSDAVPVSCIKAKIIGAYELDGDKSNKELLVLNKMCKKLKEKNKILPNVYVYLNNLEIRHYNPVTGKYDKKSIVYRIPEGKKFAQKRIAVGGNKHHYDTADDAVIVKDMNNDDRLDLILKTIDTDARGWPESIVVLYNDGKGNFKPINPKK